MTWAVFRIKDQEIVNTILMDDVISRQSISVRDSDEGKLVLLEGSEEAIKIAEELAPETRIEGDDAEAVFKEIKDEEQNVAAGIGAIFD